jgi:hypothetical protein
MKQAVEWLGALVFTFLATMALAQGDLTDAQVHAKIIEASIATYSGNCPCPYSVNAAGRRCGGSSAWSRRGGAAPLCFPDDVSDERVRAWRLRNGA